MAASEGAIKPGRLYVIESGFVDIDESEISYWCSQVDLSWRWNGERYAPYHNYNMFIPVVVPILKTLYGTFG